MTYHMKVIQGQATWGAPEYCHVSWCKAVLGQLWASQVTTPSVSAPGTGLEVTSGPCLSHARTGRLSSWGTACLLRIRKDVKHDKNPPKMLQYGKSVTTALKPQLRHNQISFWIWCRLKHSESPVGQWQTAIPSAIDLHESRKQLKPWNENSIHKD